MVSLLPEDTVNRLPVAMGSLLQAPVAILNSNLVATPLSNSQEGTHPRAAATHQHLVSMSEHKL